MNDLISGQAANTRVAQNGKYKYTFGNDEFNLEAAYHDCKFVFDGITDDDSFQEADTGLILYYANEIIYALHKALKGNDTNVPSNDCIDRAEAQTAIQFAARRYTVAHEAHGEGQVVWSENLINATDAMNALRDLPSAQPEPLTDKEQRIFLAAMGREEKVCKEVDRNHVREPYEDSLMRVCKEIRRKVKGALWT